MTAVIIKTTSRKNEVRVETEIRVETDAPTLLREGRNIGL